MPKKKVSTKLSSSKKLEESSKPQTQANVESLYLRVSDHIDRARHSIQRSVNTEMVKTYWLIGQEIVLDEQQGKHRAEYGKAVLVSLSKKLQTKYKGGFGVDTLEQARKFYLTYPLPVENKKSDALRRKFLIPDFHPNLSWTTYRELIRVSRPEARKFYEVETIKNNWSSRELKRQIGSLLFDRLSKSKDKKGLLALANKGHEITTPEDALKDPFILEFLGLPESHQLVEAKVEQALITNLQKFLLELGSGFAFVARQKRLTLEGDHFYADLVFYHVILKCYIIFDIKCRPLNHGDIGQMLLYVNYFDREIKMETDNPTIGVLLCTEKNDAVVKYALDEKTKQIFASKYQFHLPTESELEEELKREIRAIKHELNNGDEGVK